MQFIKNYFNDDEILYLFFLDRINKTRPIQRYTSANRNNFNLLLSQAIEKNKYGFDIYFSLNSFKFIERKIKRTKKYVKEVKSIYFDIDEDAINILNKITSIPTFANPTYTIQTSQEKYQLIYKLTNPLRENFDEFEQILKFLVGYFGTDKTYDISRIFRLPNLINNKNGFNVESTYNDAYINFEDVKKFAFDNGFTFLADDDKKSTKRKTKKESSNLGQKPLKSLKFDITQYKETITKKSTQYDYLLRKYNYDNSTADLAYCRWLYYKKGIKKDITIIKKLISARGYDDLTTAHPYIDDYIESLLIKCKKEL